MKPEHIIAICSAVVSLSALCVSIYTIRSNQRQKRIDNLFSLQIFLHNPELSEARRSIREGDSPLKLNNPSLRRVCSSFDFAGSMVRHGAVNKAIFMDYWCVSLLALEQPIASIAADSTGKGVTIKDYYRDFYWLIREANATRTKSNL
jgi:hypothetical protein